MVYPNACHPPLLNTKSPRFHLTLCWNLENAPELPWSWCRRLFIRIQASWEQKKTTIIFFLGLNLIQSTPMKILKNSKIHTKSTKPIPIWTDWYPKKTQNHQNFETQSLGKIINQTINTIIKEQTLTDVCGSSSSGVEFRWYKERRSWKGFRL